MIGPSPNLFNLLNLTKSNAIFPTSFVFIEDSLNKAVELVDESLPHLKKNVSLETFFSHLNNTYECIKKNYQGCNRLERAKIFKRFGHILFTAGLLIHKENYKSSRKLYLASLFLYYSGILLDRWKSNNIIEICTISLFSYQNLDHLLENSLNEHENVINKIKFEFINNNLNIKEMLIFAKILCHLIFCDVKMWFQDKTHPLEQFNEICLDILNHIWENASIDEYHEAIEANWLLVLLHFQTDRLCHLIKNPQDFEGAAATLDRLSCFLAREGCSERRAEFILGISLIKTEDLLFLINKEEDFDKKKELLEKGILQFKKSLGFISSIPGCNPSARLDNISNRLPNGH